MELQNPNSAPSSLFEFPCRFPIKVLGATEAKIESIVKEALQKELAVQENIEIHTRPSRNGKYTSVTATFTASSKDELDRLYLFFTQHEAIEWVL